MVLMGGVAVAWPLGAEAQQSERTRRIGVLMGWAENDPETQLRLAVFKERLAALGWAEGRNLKIDVRWTGADVNRASEFAKELVALQPDVILSVTTPVTTALQRETRSIPIVFAAASDPVGSGFVKSLAHPGGNITGFINLESSLVEKWLQLLKEIAPRVTRVAVMFNPRTAPYAGYYLQALKTVATKLSVTALTATVNSEAEIEKVIAGLGRKTGGGLIVLTDSFLFVHRRSIIALAARSKVPAIYFIGTMVEDGGLISYGVNFVDLFRRAAPYVDRILRGAKPAELPVEQPTKFELFVNRKTAQALGLTLPPSLLLRADKVIE
jgi:putative ABC transport system substrate-binding protein